MRFLTHRIIPLICGLCIAFSSCNLPQEERTGVPVLGGLRWEVPEDSVYLSDNLAAFHASGIRDIMITFPLQADTSSSFLPEWPHAADNLRHIASRLQKEGFTLSLALTQRNQMQVFPAGKLINPQAWFSQLTGICDSLLILSGASRLVVGTDLLSAESFSAEWCSWASSLQEKHHIPVSYAVSVERLRGLSFAGCSSEIAVSWSAPDDGNAVAYCRDWNFMTGRVADSLGKPVFIFSPNLLGDDKSLQFRMRLRFWPQDVPVSGFHLNTLYARSALIDTTSYFGLASDAGFLAALRSYTGVAPVND